MGEAGPEPEIPPLILFSQFGASHAGGPPSFESISK